MLWGKRDGTTQQIPTTGYLKNGMSVSNYDEMPIEDLEKEGWTDITDVCPFVEEVVNTEIAESEFTESTESTESIEIIDDNNNLTNQ